MTPETTELTTIYFFDKTQQKQSLKLESNYETPKF